MISLAHKRYLSDLFSSIPNLRKYKSLGFLLVSTPRRVMYVQLLSVMLAVGECSLKKELMGLKAG